MKNNVTLLEEIEQNRSYSIHIKKINTIYSKRSSIHSAIEGAESLMKT